VGDPDVLGEMKAPPRKAVALDEGERAALLAHLDAAARRLVAGVHHTTLASPEDAGCRYCDFSRVCRVDPARNAAVADAHDPRWQAPRTEAE
jgi:hypothetical protein